MPNQIQPFLHRLKSEWAKKAAHNPRYSLRAYARFLKVEPSYLSKVLRGQRPVTPELVHRFGKRLGFTADELEAYAASLARGKKGGATQLSPVTGAAWVMVKAWYYTAILELTETKAFDPSPKAIAKKLAITPIEAEVAVSELVGAGLLKRGKNGALKSAGPNTTLGQRPTSEQQRAYLKQVIEKSAQALETVPFERRNHTALTVAINSERLPKLIERLKKLRQEILAIANDAKDEGSKDAVYQLSLSLYPLTDIED